MHFFITGHTGFKGSWLSEILLSAGHEVTGLALPSVKGSLFENLRIEDRLRQHWLGDIRDPELITRAFSKAKPDVAIHLAAQSLVGRAFLAPRETYEVNVSGTLNFLEAASRAEELRAGLVITTDKVYRDNGHGPYAEVDPLGALEPYGASKAMADILTQAWQGVHPGLPLGIARAGNVVGLGDHNLGRLVPDILNALSSNSRLSVRNLVAIRPWQHVLDCLNGYLAFINAIVENPKDFPKVLNFGPEPESFRSVRDVLDVAVVSHPSLTLLESQAAPEFKETLELTLNSSLALNTLGWVNHLSFEESIRWSLEELASSAIPATVRSQIRRFRDIGGLSVFHD